MALGPRFHGYMTGLHHSPGLRTQRFFMTFMARYHGLSVLGGDLLSPMEMMMPSSTYEAMLKTVVDRRAERQVLRIDMIEEQISLYILSEYVHIPINIDRLR